MKTQYIFPAGLVVVLLIVGGVYYFHTKESDQQVAPAAATTTTTDTSASYSMTDVASHSSKASCWTAIEGNVYDLTPWISKHPGGETAILSICGKDGTKAFEGQHGGQSKPEQMLATFKIGTLAQ